jgi:hypothetical protein
MFYKHNFQLKELKVLKPTKTTDPAASTMFGHVSQYFFLDIFLIFNNQHLQSCTHRSTGTVVRKLTSGVRSYNGIGIIGAVLANLHLTDL